MDIVTIGEVLIDLTQTGKDARGIPQFAANPGGAPDAWVTTWDSHNPGVLALVRKRGEETLVGLFNFTEYPAGASLDALGGEYHAPEGTSVWLADVELEPYQALLVKNK